MEQKPAEERSVRELRAALADVLNAATVRDQITYVTSRGRRIAAVVPVGIAEASAVGAQAAADAQTAEMYGINCVMMEDKPPPGQTPEQVFEGYAAYLLEQLGGDKDRFLAAARAATIAAADEVGWPGRWRPAMRAVELCRRAADLAAEATAAD
jgi:prevent-host-death family protein